MPDMVKEFVEEIEQAINILELDFSREEILKSLSYVRDRIVSNHFYPTLYWNEDLECGCFYGELTMNLMNINLQEYETPYWYKEGGGLIEMTGIERYLLNLEGSKDYSLLLEAIE